MREREIMTPKYIVDAAQQKGFREGTITQAWIPIEFHLDVCPALDEHIAPLGYVDGWGVFHTHGRRTHPVEILDCPYAVGDVLKIQRQRAIESPTVIKKATFTLCYCSITSVEAKTLGEMTEPNALMAGMAFSGVPETDMEANVHKYRVIEWWNARYPEQPWDKDLWCWVLGIEVRSISRVQDY